MIWFFVAAAGVLPAAVTLWVGWRSLSPPRQGPPGHARLAAHGAEAVSWPAGGRTYTAYRVVPADRPPLGAVLLIHGWGSSGSDMLDWARLLGEEGWASLSLDMRGQGASPREAVVTLPDLAADVQAAWNWMGESGDFGTLPRFILGHSMGGAASLYAVTCLGVTPKALILSSAFARVGVITSYVLRKWKMPTFPFRHLVAPVWNWRTGLRVKDFEPEALIGKVPVPVLVTHGSEDPVVPAGEMRRLLARAPLHAESVEIPGAEHSDLYAFPEYRASVVSFLNRNL